MNNWKETTLGGVLGEKGYIRGPFGSSLRRNELSTEGIPVYEQQNAIYDNREFTYFIDNQKYEELTRFTVKEHDLIISCSGTIGKISIIKRDDPVGIISQALLILRPDTTQILPKYLYYFFSSAEGFNSLVSRSSGSVQVNIAERKIIQGIEFPLPPLPEQKSITGILSSFDDKIELLRRQNKTLEQIARTIFKEWFVKFTVNGKKLKVNSKTGLPEGWTQKGLDEIADFLNGLALQNHPPENEADVLPVIKIRELNAGITAQTDKASKKIATQYIIDDGDVLFSWSGSLYIVLWCYGKGALNQHLFKVTSKKCPKWFYYNWILEYLPFFKSIAEAKATTMGHIQRHHLAEALVAVPDDHFMAFADSKIKPVFEHIALNNSQIQILSKLRDALLPKLMKGEIRIKL